MSAARVLVLDDEAAVGSLVARVATKLGFEVSVTQESEAFRRQYSGADPAVILLDLTLPDADGIEILKYLAKRNCKSQILLISGSDETVINTAKRLGQAQGLNVVGTLRKPFAVGSLRSELDRARENSAAANDDCRASPAAELRLAIANDEIAVHYQPKVDVCSRRVLGAEALVRWPHPQRGLLPPAEFLPLAERAELIIPLSLAVLGEAIRQGVAWRRSGLDLAVAVNLPAQALNDLTLPEQIIGRLDEEGLPGSSLVLEVTEAGAMKNVGSAMDILSRLRLAGVGLSIDDFGTGYSSLAKLQKMPFDEIKIDRSFVSDAHVNDDSRVIVRTIIDLAHNLGMKAVAEGVETQDVWDRLHDWGCDIVQGYYVSRPLPASEFEDWHREWPPPLAEA